MVSSSNSNKGLVRVILHLLNNSTTNNNNSSNPPHLVSLHNSSNNSSTFHTSKSQFNNKVMVHLRPNNTSNNKSRRVEVTDMSMEVKLHSQVMVNHFWTLLILDKRDSEL